ncbi:alpha-galactosidase [Clostridium grantii]|uniref:alpha-galactosidase n=1 Tax=Clostridium grantii DSM 8605 TaxID=1121316 RepID=A0A1M5X697_9CLOT|nr:alpha-galactosidase [Clostridium grantii]SHH95306.1 alpha-galactosidase [Clostridium grantii DSM 8605]
MAIIFNENNKEFHLITENTSYIMKVLESGHLGHLYYGERLRHKSNFDNLYLSFSLDIGNSVSYSSETKDFNLNVALLEYPTYGKGDYRSPALELLFENGNSTADFKYESHSINEGKSPLVQLPSTYNNEKDAETLQINLYDYVEDVRLEISYSVFSEADIITRNVRIINGNKQKVRINKAMSMNLDMFTEDYSNYEIITLDGAWIRERHINKRPLSQGIFKIDSKKGVSGSDHSPFICIKKSETNEEKGECYGFALVYSGNHEASLELSPHLLTRMQMGINSFDFNWLLEQGQDLQTPEVVLTFSSEGMNKMSQNFHNIIQNNLVRGEWKHKERPVLINNWEATYMDFNEKKILNLAKESKKLGIELFVLDDGWFGKRNDDKSSLGDWFVNKDKLPSGIDGLAKKINDMGLQFGIWVEPEMISYDSQLFKAHPHWVMRLPERELSMGRNQAVLDLANPEVCDYIYECLAKLFKESNISYVKWDMNRNFSDIYSNYLPKERQREITHRYVLGLYGILEKLNNEFPHILFESCAAGGNRFDMGMLYYMPQTWTSDNTDAIERVYIQEGTSLVFPPSTMAAHVSGNVNHQVMRSTPIETRFNTAAFGLLGYELDVTKLTNFEKKIVTKQIEYYKKHRKLLQFGTFYREKSFFNSKCTSNSNSSSDNVAIWSMVSRDRDESFIGYYQKLAKPNPSYEKIYPLGLKDESYYRVENREQYINVRSFGEMINNFLPVKIKENGLIHNTISNNYLYKLPSESMEGNGDEFMKAGIKLNHQFTGTGFNDNVRAVLDYGSRMYYVKEKIN